MHDLGAIIWVIVVIIGVISSIVKNVKQASAKAQPRRPVSRSAGIAPQSASAAAAAQTLAGPAAASVLESPPTAAVAPPPLPVPIRRKAAPMGVQAATSSAARAVDAAPPLLGGLTLPASFHLDYVPGRRSTGFIGGMFKDKRAFVRAIVAAEVLGKPKSMQEQSIWSPRHSEPSI